MPPAMRMSHSRFRTLKPYPMDMIPRTISTDNVIAKRPLASLITKTCAERSAVLPDNTIKMAAVMPENTSTQASDGRHSVCHQGLPSSGIVGIAVAQEMKSTAKIIATKAATDVYRQLSPIVASNVKAATKIKSFFFIVVKF